jgi:hypothetical protein
VEEVAIVLAVGVINGLIKVVDLVQRARNLTDEKKQRALQALYAALKETSAYVDTLNRGGEPNLDMERNIACLWDEVSIPLYDLDRDLAERCSLKGNYWRNPDTWSAMRVRRNRIGLDQVRKSAQGLLHGDKKGRFPISRRDSGAK